MINSNIYKSRSQPTSAFFITNKLLLLVTLSLLVSCGATKVDPDTQISLSYLDDFTFKEQTDVKFGGISGLDYANDTIYMISDSGARPYIFVSKIAINREQLKVNPPKILSKLNPPENDYFDLESINKFPEQNAFLISNEGNIKNNIMPGVFKIDIKSGLLSSYKLPKEYRLNQKKSTIVHNRAFEAATFDSSHEGFWFSTEFPTTENGKPPKLLKSGAEQSIYYYDFKAKKSTNQLFYKLEAIPKLPLLPYSLNGLTGMEMISAHEMITIERGFSAGWGKHSNRVKLYLLESKQQLKSADRQSIKKHLLLDLKSIKKEMKADRIDNIEGICLGPDLADGSPTIFLISDDNFDAYNDQITQIIWLKINR